MWYAKHPFKLAALCMWWKLKFHTKSLPFSCSFLKQFPFFGVIHVFSCVKVETWVNQRALDWYMLYCLVNAQPESRHPIFRFLCPLLIIGYIYRKEHNKILLKVHEIYLFWSSFAQRTVLKTFVDITLLFCACTRYSQQVWIEKILLWMKTWGAIFGKTAESPTNIFKT